MRDLVRTKLHTACREARQEKWVPKRAYLSSMGGRILEPGVEYSYQDGMPLYNGQYTYLSSNTYTGSFYNVHKYRGYLRQSDGFKPTPYHGADLSTYIDHDNDRVPFRKYSESDNGIRYRRDVVTYALPTLQWGSDPFGNDLYLESNTKKERVNVPYAISSEAVNKTLKRVNDSKLDLAVSLAEASESVGLIKQTLMTAARVYRAGRRGDAKGVIKALGIRRFSDLKDFLGSTTLAVQLGWRPLIGEVHDSIGVLMDGLENELGMATCHSKHSGSDDYSDSGHYWNGYQVFGTARYDVTHQINYRISQSHISNLRKLGLINPLSVAWELVPLSFVTDWFVNYGDFLANLTATAGLEFHSGFRTDYVKLDRYLTRESLSPGSRFHFRGTCFERIQLFDFPGPSLTYGSGLGAGSRSITALALINQLSGRAR